MDKFKFLVLKAFGNDPKVSLTYVAVIYDFKNYYDIFVDEKVKNKQYSQVEKTQLVFRITPLRPGLDDAAKLNYGLLVRTNYRKNAQDVNVMLRKSVGIFGSKNEEMDRPLEPKLIFSQWIPENGTDICDCHEHCGATFCQGKEKLCGISFLKTEPIGFPKPMPLKPFHDIFTDFMVRTRKHFKSIDQSVFKEWKIVRDLLMPKSDNVQDYIDEHGLNSPLPQLFKETMETNERANPEMFTPTPNDAVSSTLMTGFTNYQERASQFDFALMEHIKQDMQTLPWRGKPKIPIQWEFTNNPNILSRIILTQGSGETKSEKEATVVAWARETINDPVIYKVIFDDVYLHNIDPIIIKYTDFPTARSDYLKKYPQQRTLKEEGAYRVHQEKENAKQRAITRKEKADKTREEKGNPKRRNNKTNENVEM